MKSILRLPAALAALVGAACDRPPANRDPGVPLTTEKPVELSQYLGLWYEIARFPNRFEEDCVGVTAEYSLRDDGMIRVVNTCRKETLDGETEVAEGRARITDAPRNSKLEVSFFGPFFSDYWVLDRADDYSWSLVGEPEGRYLWILARTPTMTDALRDDLLNRLRGKGYDTSALYFTPQPPAGDGASGPR